MNTPLKFDERGHGMMARNGQVVFIGDEVIVTKGKALEKYEGTLSAIDSNHVLIKASEGNLIISRDCVLSGRYSG